MRVESGKLQGDLVVEENEELDLRGMVTGHVRLQRGTTFILRGTVGGTLTVGAGAKAMVHGTVGHSAFNAGGILEISGVVGRSVATDSGRTIIAAGSIIGGVRQERRLEHSGRE
jgi:uncharacterized membrane protein